MASCTNTTVRFKLRRATDPEWLAADPVLLEGEPAYSTNSNLLKIGDGNRPWSQLPYINTAGVQGISGQIGVPTNMAVSAYLSASSKNGPDIILSSNPSPALVAGQLVFFTTSVTDISVNQRGIIAYAPYYVVSHTVESLKVRVSLTQTPLVPY
jgi:hypothetical protein